MISNIAVKARVGLIDDDLSVRRAVGRLLWTHGYVCATYDSAEAALVDPAFMEMDCIIVDVQLGGMNGFELCSRLDELKVRIPHIFITAHAESDLPDILVDSIVLTKPFEENQLIASIQSSIGIPGAGSL